MYPFAPPMCIIEKENLQFHPEDIAKHYKGEKLCKMDLKNINKVRNTGVKGCNVI
jgi:hypothetical protein